ncbi:NADH:flavin oxidoreductase [Desulfosporosinus nitroreducens]|uniref:NADH:flavin oxidoreductase n=1 Tax=Desulfosporosinus nitroreducens TaxID=2018668 RepID=UPI00207C1BB8|nr:NADH:flavin oxidoreductase [Desulfosporosinus nitroreducens]MCO1602518.1 NADH:flavin oxidoreductase [Desulfosporosinus nitroreducens]
MSILLDPFTIRNLEIRNRFVRSATYDGFANENGHVSDAQIKLFSDLADGGAGLIIAGIAYVHYTGQISPHQNSIAGDQFISGFEKVTKAVHERGAKIAIQLFHGGKEAKYLKTKNILPLAPSIVDNAPYYSGEYREITDSEIWEVINAFGDGAIRAKEAGFDAVQVHGAHAYLLSQFLSPFTNRRQDQWGGSLQNRLRLHYEIYKNIRKKVGEDYPVFIKIGVQDGFIGGLQLDEGKESAKLLAKLGFDSLEISQGLRGKRYEETEYKAHIDSLNKEAYYREWCREIKSQLDVPIMIVGGLRTLSLMEEIVQNKEADCVSLCRPFICEPGLVNDWETNEHKKPKCISCNKCVDAIYKGKPINCILTTPQV